MVYQHEYTSEQYLNLIQFYLKLKYFRMLIKKHLEKDIDLLLKVNTLQKTGV